MKKGCSRERHGRVGVASEPEQIGRKAPDVEKQWMLTHFRFP